MTACGHVEVEYQGDPLQSRCGVVLCGEMGWRCCCCCYCTSGARGPGRSHPGRRPHLLVERPSASMSVHTPTRHLCLEWEDGAAVGVGVGLGAGGWGVMGVGWGFAWPLQHIRPSPSASILHLFCSSGEAHTRNFIRSGGHPSLSHPVLHAPLTLHNVFREWEPSPYSSPSPKNRC